MREITTDNIDTIRINDFLYVAKVKGDNVRLFVLTNYNGRCDGYCFTEHAKIEWPTLFATGEILPVFEDMMTKYPKILDIHIFEMTQEEYCRERMALLTKPEISDGYTMLFAQIVESAKKYQTTLQKFCEVNNKIVELAKERKRLLDKLL